MTLEWSEEFEFAPGTIKSKIPTSPGVYEIFQSFEYPRYQGATRVLKIGMSKCDLRKELLNHRDRHTAARRLLRISKRPQLSVTCRVSLIDSERAIHTEKDLLQDFENKHWELPLLNSQRGFKRNEDCHW